MEGGGATEDNPGTRSVVVGRLQGNQIRINWTDQSITQLLDTIRQFEVVYNPKHPRYKDKHERNDTWMSIAKSLAIVNDDRLLPMFARECERKYKIVRDEYLKSLKRPGRVRPYRHADKLTFLNDVVPHFSHASSIVFYEDGDSRIIDHEYRDDMIEGMAVEGIYSADQLLEHSNGLVYASQHRPVASKRVKKSTRDEDSYYYGTPTGVYSHYEDNAPSGSGSRVRPPEKEKETDELDDFTKMLVKRMRRLPMDHWGQAMSRLMETLSNAEESAKKVATKTSGCQTGD